MSHNADPCYVAIHGFTSFQYAALYCGQHPRILDLLDKLYELGADINAKNSAGLSSLTNTVYGNCHLALRWLLNHGADYRIIANSGTVLHYAGFYGDLQTIQILRAARLSGIDVGKKDDSAEGITAMDEMLSKSRVPLASDELVASFARLISEVKARTNGQPDPYSNDTTPEPETQPSVSDAMADSSQTTEYISDSSEEHSGDEEQVFVDSVEVQPAESVGTGEASSDEDLNTASC